MQTNPSQPPCLICGAPLRYADHAEEMECSICHRHFSSNAQCENGHFVCDECHAAPGIGAIRHICQTTTAKNPYEIAVVMMTHPAVHLHGPEHHVLVGAALLGAYHNAGGSVDLPAALDEMVRRGSMVPGGFCGFAGSCGAAVSAGMFYAIVTKTTPLSTESWGHANLLTAECLTAIGSAGGPRCCKRNTFLAVRTASSFVAHNLGVALALPEKMHCHFSAKNRECLEERCPFFSGT